MTLDEINAKSINQIVFDDGFVDIDQLDYLNYVFTKNGVYIVQKNEFAITYSLMKEFKYKNLGLREYDFDTSVELLLPKCTKQMFEKILECFKYVLGDIQHELLTIIYYDTTKKEYILDIIKTQVVSKASVEYKYTDEYEMSDRYIKYCEIHS